MDEKSILTLKDACRLVREWNDSAVKEQVLGTFYYNNRSVFEYINYLNYLSPAFSEKYGKLFRQNPGSSRKYWKNFIESIDSYFIHCSNSGAELDKVYTAVTTAFAQTSHLSSEQLERLRQLEAMQAGSKKMDLIDAYLNQLQSKSGKEENPVDVNVVKEGLDKLKNTSNREQIDELQTEIDELLSSGKATEEKLDYLTKQLYALKGSAYNDSVDQLILKLNTKQSQKDKNEEPSESKNIYDEDITAMPVADSIKAMTQKERDTKKAADKLAELKTKLEKYNVDTEKINALAERLNKERNISNAAIIDGILFELYKNAGENVTFDDNISASVRKLYSFSGIKKDALDDLISKYSASKKVNLLESESIDRPVAIHATDDTPRKATIPIDAFKDKLDNPAVKYATEEAAHRARLATIRGIPYLKGVIIGFFSNIFKNLLSIPVGQEAITPTSQRQEYYISPSTYLEEGFDEFPEDDIGGDFSETENNQSRKQTNNLRTNDYSYRRFNAVKNNYRNLRKRAENIKKLAKLRSTVAKSRIAIILITYWWVFLLIGILAAILFVWFPDINKNASLCFPSCGKTSEMPVVSSLKLTKTGTPPDMGNPDPNNPDSGRIDYTININYNNAGSAIAEIIDRVPQNTVFKNISDPPPTKYEEGVLYWTIDTNSVKQIKFSVNAINNDVWVKNFAEGKIVSLNLGSAIQPSTLSCNKAEYQAMMNKTANTTFFRDGNLSVKPYIDAVQGKNFGDPNCDFNQNKLYDLLYQLDPQDAEYWFTVVIRGESGYNPNAFRSPWETPQTPDPNGAWGLYQMSATNRAGEYDMGAVDWITQTQNAVNRKNKFSWCYWGTAFTKCALELQGI